MPIPECWFGIPGGFTLREFPKGVDMHELLEALECARTTSQALGSACGEQLEFPPG